MKDVYILAIETSCDETSASIVRNGHDDIATVILSQMDIHSSFGGVVPEIASRHHAENITIVIEECLNKAGMTIKDIDAVAATYGPGLVGSLLVGFNAAKTLCFVHNIPFIPIHHIAGHIYANNLVKALEFPLIALVVSGGHTELVLMNEDYSFKRIGATLDDAVGEAYDKVARVLGLDYPGGPIIDKLASEGEDIYPLPLPMDDDSYNFSFSGLKSAVINLIHKEKQRDNEINSPDMASSFQNRVIEILTKKTIRAMHEYEVKNLIVAGGVAANKGLRARLELECKNNNFELLIPDFKYCTDNATMIGSAAYFAYKLGYTAGLDTYTSSSEILR